MLFIVAIGEPTEKDLKEPYQKYLMYMLWFNLILSSNFILFALKKLATVTDSNLSIQSCILLSS